MLERYRYLIFSGVLLAILAGLIALLTYRPPATVITILPPPPTASPAPSATPGPVRVDVTGAVVNANAIYSLPPGSRVQDAVNAAGGFAPGADKDSVNLAQVLSDGQQVHIPIIGEKVAAPASSGAAAKASPGDPVHINAATLTELQRLPGVGPAIAQDILTYRQQHGPFKTLDDLDDVPGIGSTRLEQWQGLIVFD
jgi:competence protein ComEA